MKRTAAVVVILAGALLLFQGTTASAGIGNGPCQHGNSNKACKEDPSSNGKDCDKHGNKGGENQDHCVQGSTPEPSPSSSVGGSDGGGSDGGGSDGGGSDGGGSDGGGSTGGTTTEGGTSVQGKIVRAPTISGGSLAKTGPAQTTSALGIGLLLVGIGFMTRTFGKKEDLQA